MSCQSVESPIASAKVSGIPNSVIEIEGEAFGAALRAIAFWSALLWIEWMIGGATQRPIRLWEKS